MFWTKGKGWWNSPAMAPDDGGAGGGDGADTGEAAGGADAATVLYPDDKPAGGDDADAGANSDAGAAQKNATDGADASKGDAETGSGDEAGADEWKPYEDDPALSDEENAAKRAENDAKHPINQVPEDGKYQLTMPEGVEVDQPLLDALGPVMAELKLSNGHAQMLADKFIEAQTAAATKRSEEWAHTITEWGEKAQNDPEMGGAKWDQTKTHALAAVTRFGTPELKQYLEASGAGNHPEIIRLMAKVGAMIGEDVPAISDNPGKGAEVDPARVMYPNDKPKGP